MKDKAGTWYETSFEFRQLCGDAVSQSRTEKDQEFANEMMKRANAYGLETFVSEPQLRWLCNIADHDVPKRRKVQ